MLPAARLRRPSGHPGRRALILAFAFALFLVPPAPAAAPARTGQPRLRSTSPAGGKAPARHELEEVGEPEDVVVAATAQPQTGIAPIAVSSFAQYVTANICRNPDPPRTSQQVAAIAAAEDVGCLEILQFPACRSGCWRKGYNYRFAAETAGRLDFHMSLGYLRELRNRLSEELLHGQAFKNERTFGMTLKDLVYSQVQMTLRHPRMRFYKGDGTVPISLDDVVTERTVDPGKFTALTFTNGSAAFPDQSGTAHAMTQADMMRWFASVAETLASRGHDGTYYLQLAERAFEPFAIADRFNGIRNDKPDFKCHGDAYCYWFHSQEITDYTFPASVLNKDVYAIRDLLDTAHGLKHWQQFGTCNCTTKSCRQGFSNQSKVLDGAPPSRYQCPKPGRSFPIGSVASDLADDMLELARGGLFNLAYGPGNAGFVGAWYKTPPPNLREFMAPDGITNGRRYFRSYYRYWILDKPSEDIVRGPSDIRAENNCHYHYLTLKLFREALALTEESAFLFQDAGFRDVRYSLLYGRDPSTSSRSRNRACTGTSPSLDRVAGVPLAELYLAGRTVTLPYQKAGGYPNGQNRCSASVATFISESEGSKAWYDEKYRRCRF